MKAAHILATKNTLLAKSVGHQLFPQARDFRRMDRSRLRPSGPPPTRRWSGAQVTLHLQVTLHAAMVGWQRRVHKQDGFICRVSPSLHSSLSTGIC